MTEKHRKFFLYFNSLLFLVGIFAIYGVGRSPSTLYYSQSKELFSKLSFDYKLESFGYLLLSHPLTANFDIYYYYFFNYIFLLTGISLFANGIINKSKAPFYSIVAFFSLPIFKILTNWLGMSDSFSLLISALFVAQPVNFIWLCAIAFISGTVHFHIHFLQLIILSCYKFYDKKRGIRELSLPPLACLIGYFVVKLIIYLNSYVVVKSRYEFNGLGVINEAQAYLDYNIILLIAFTFGVFGFMWILLNLRQGLFSISILLIALVISLLTKDVSRVFGLITIPVFYRITLESASQFSWIARWVIFLGLLAFIGFGIHGFLWGDEIYFFENHNTVMLFPAK